MRSGTVRVGKARDERDEGVRRAGSAWDHCVATATCGPRSRRLRPAALCGRALDSRLAG